MKLTLEHLPDDWRAATLVGRLMTADGPSPVIVHEGHLFDASGIAATVSELLNRWDPAEAQSGRSIGPVEDLEIVPALDGSGLLAPIDLQCIKAAGVTFADSALERVIEERARGNAADAKTIRLNLQNRIGAELRVVRPGSEQARRLKDALIDDGLWSPYLEVAIGPDAEIFTKAAVLSAVGWGQPVGVRSDSCWNNPEPEVVLVAAPDGRVLGATLGNDVNLRDFEGRSALLLSKAKDNNASCAIGPFIRLFDANFGIDDVRTAVVSLEVVGLDGFRLEGKSTMQSISRDPLDLVSQVLSEHQYPDGFALFLGTLFSPVQDRNAPGRGFTHEIGDRVRISSPKLGKLENVVTTSRDAPPWTLGIGHLMQNLARRGLLDRH